MNTITIASNLHNQADFNQDWQLFTPILADELTKAHKDLPLIGMLEQYVNGKGLACPMPLLKLKMAIRSTAIGNHVYVSATDPNSQLDIAAFCQHMGYTLYTGKSTTDMATPALDTIFHLLITKNC